MQRIKVGEEQNSWKEIMVFQRFYTWFNIFQHSSDMLFIIRHVEIASFANVDTPPMSANIITNLVQDLEDSK